MARSSTKFGPVKMEDGMQRDGLVDAYEQVAMGVCADECAVEYNFSREDQDAFAIESYNRSAKAWSEGKFADEVVPVEIPQRRGEPIIFSEDEEYKKCKNGKKSLLYVLHLQKKVQLQQLMHLLLMMEVQH